MAQGMGDLARNQGEMAPSAAQSQISGERDTGDYSESNYDEFSGYDDGVPEKLYLAFQDAHLFICMY
jgi:hypothetical protein